MGEFFDNRLEGYEEHQLNCIESAREFYAYTAEQLPKFPGSQILDLGCGTGLELSEYFKRNPNAVVTGIDLASGMLQFLKNKFSDKQLTLINDSYFNVFFGESVYDAAVSVESLHHFTMKQKIPLYKKIHKALAEKGYFILTNYIIESPKEEQKNFQELKRLKTESGICDDEFYHYDTPLTREHETEALLSGGFSKIECISRWGNTTMLKAHR